ncbi:MAG: hypothetical protein HFH87_13285 [Lachnospiraceae bacterium]|jgi:hypothetical protein|nr:hypothetical protein [Lachnospiraceae bacterium]
MNKKNEATREKARQILKDGICDMSIARLIQMSQFGLMGNIKLSNGTLTVENVFNHISYDVENNAISFSVEESQGSYGAISFPVDAISEISGCEDKENPEEYLDVDIKLNDGMTIVIKILY